MTPLINPLETVLHLTQHPLYKKIHPTKGNIHAIAMHLQALRIALSIELQRKQLCEPGQHPAQSKPREKVDEKHAPDEENCGKQT